MKVSASLRATISPTTCPEATSMAAIRAAVPWRLYSNSRRAARPGGCRDVGVLAGAGRDRGLLVDGQQYRAGRHRHRRGHPTPGFIGSLTQTVRSSPVGRVHAAQPAAAPERARRRPLACAWPGSRCATAPDSPTSTAACPTATVLKLCRLRFSGRLHTWGFAIWLASRDGYEENLLPTELPAGSPEEALDCACGLYLGDPAACDNPSRINAALQLVQAGPPAPSAPPAPCVLADAGAP